jgi:hypothetical protein
MALNSMNGDTGGQALEVLWRSQMSAQALRVVREAHTAAEPEVLIHVRFHPNADVAIVGEQPGHLKPQAWFNLLCEEALRHYRGLAGGRGFFRIPRSAFEAIRAKA